MAKKKRASRPSEYQWHYIIPIMGPTGAGKSFFINSLLGRSVVGVGHKLTSCTTNLEPVEIPADIVQKHLPFWNPGSPRPAKLVLVDTPGFDDTHADDSQILRRVADWLAKSYGVGAKLAGIIYLQDITRYRVAGATKRNFDLIDKLCGTEACKSVALATTKWQRLHQDDTPLGPLREQQLRDKFWRDMLARGSTMMRMDCKADASPWDVVWTVLSKGQSPTLLIQEELMKLRKTLPQTEAAQGLKARIEELVESLKSAGPRSATSVEDVTALGTLEHSSIILVRGSPQSSNFNLEAARLAQAPSIAPTTPSSTSTEYGSIFIFRDLSSQSSFPSATSWPHGRPRMSTL